LIALRQYFTYCLSETAELRIKKGTAMLFDRACPAGGWNAGNGVAYGVPLKPHADVTSLALVALLPEKNHRLVQKSLDWLHGQWETMPSIYGLSWLAMALVAYQPSVELIMKRIVQLYNQRGMNQDCEILALSRIAVQVADGANPFR
jgi:hypothetical protein